MKCSNGRSSRWRIALLSGILLLFAGCETVEPEPGIWFAPSSLNVRVGESRDFSGIVSLGVPSGSWFVQPNSIQSAFIEVTGDITARLTCNSTGAGAFLLSILTNQGMASGSIYFTCSP